jgi:hypothetical protein
VSTASFNGVRAAAEQSRANAGNDDGQRQRRKATEETGTGSRPWPELDHAAHLGLAGDVVRMIEPHSEADPIAILVQLIVVFGSVIGHQAHFVIEGTRHYLNLFTVLVGLSSRGRKGTALGRTLEVLPPSVALWKKNRIQSGLSSGEGLIWAVRDRTEHMVKGKPVIEEGVEDKRLLVQEPEFGSVLKVISREGNTLSPTVRCAWDSGNLRTMTKNSPAVSTDAHISIIGHITADELRRHLHSTEAGNGFGNRFLWVCVQRSKVLPFGGNLEPKALEPLTERITQALAFASRAGEMLMNEEARELWQSVYPELSAGRAGLLGALTARAEAQARRLACLFALLDQTSVVSRSHLLAGLAIVKYSERSVEYIFGDTLGDPVADEILSALRAASDGLTRTEIRDYFGRNRSGAEISRALGVLFRARLAVPEMEETGGRQAERWRAVRSVPLTTKTTETTEGEGDRP